MIARKTALLLGSALAAGALAPVACVFDPVQTSASSSSASSSGAGGTGAGGAGGAGGGDHCVALGVSKGPWTIRMKADGITLRWEACRKGTSPKVFVQEEKGGADVEVTSTETPFTVDATITAPLNPDATPDYAGTYYMHETVLSGLKASTCYAYRLGADESKKGRFCTARAPGEPIRFLAIGDTNPGLGGSTASVLKYALPKNPDFTVHGGDIQYYDSFVETWASWFPVMEPLLAQGAFFPAIGNHESEKPKEIDEYEQRFFSAAGFDGQGTYYRFQSGGVWFFALDTELALDQTSPQYTWFEKEIADASTQPGYRFSIVYFHKPFLTCGDTGDNPVAYATYEPIFTQYGVPLVIQAHMHGYERFVTSARTYITAAGGGGRIGNPDANTSRPYCNQRVASGGFKHAVIVDVGKASLDGVVIDEDDKTRDTFSIVVP